MLSWFVALITGAVAGGLTGSVAARVYVVKSISGGGNSQNQVGTTNSNVFGEARFDGGFTQTIRTDAAATQPTLRVIHNDGSGYVLQVGAVGPGAIEVLNLSLISGQTDPQVALAGPITVSAEQAISRKIIPLTKTLLFSVDYRTDDGGGASRRFEVVIDGDVT